MRYLIFYVVFFVSAACQMQEQKDSNRFSDPEMVKIADLQDRRVTDSLLQFIEHDNPKYSRQAILAFGSVQDTGALNHLNSCLRLSKDELVEAAAFALGQMGNDEKILEEIPGGLSNDGAYLEIGKFDIQRGHHSSVDNKSIPWAYYRYGSYASVNDSAALNVIRFVNDSNEYARLGVVHFFARSNTFDTISSSNANRILKLLTERAITDSAEIRMAAIAALRKSKNDSAKIVIERSALSDKDYRVRVNAVRALRSFPYQDIKQTLIKTLLDENINVGIATSEMIKPFVTKENWKEIAAIARKTSNWRIQATLFDAALAASDNKELAEEIVRLVKGASNPYQKAALLSALQSSVMSFGFVQEQLFQADTAVVKSTAAATLVALNYHKNFRDSDREKFLAIYIQAIEQGDAAVIGIIAPALGDSTLGYKTIIRDISFLHKAKEKLSLPKDNEALQPLEAAIAYFEGNKNPSPVKNEFNHPIDWKLVKSIPADQQVLIKTTKGDIVIQLLVEEAPGSVANFVELIHRKYFDKKFFHRVVPNFVIQAGCNRGDGWGSEDYSIRSEFSPRKYKTGSVGMASAGKDTEGTQWFITHSPTPHLDGRYTIFAEVAEGMDVVHRIEVGDMILSVTMLP